jgi:arsenate reductase
MVKVDVANSKKNTNKLADQILPELHVTIQDLQSSFALIPESRKFILNKLTQYLKSQKDKAIQLNFICTHNSRRSHLGMIWAAVASTVYKVPMVQTFSGGTEATAFNPRAVTALRTVGFEIPPAVGDNPTYLVHFASDFEPLKCFSKTYDDDSNPERDFAAIMTCAEADDNCPFIPGASFRLPLTYEDPKQADDTPEETARYLERTRQIGRELLYAFSRV